MEKINFVNNSEPYLSAENLNQMQSNIENEFNSLTSKLIPLTGTSSISEGTITLNKNITDYDFVFVQSGYASTNTLMSFMCIPFGGRISNALQISETLNGLTFDGHFQINITGENELTVVSTDNPIRYIIGGKWK